MSLTEAVGEPEGLILTTSNPKAPAARSKIRAGARPILRSKVFVFDRWPWAGCLWT